MTAATTAATIASTAVTIAPDIAATEGQGQGRRGKAAPPPSTMQDVQSVESLLERTFRDDVLGYYPDPVLSTDTEPASANHKGKGEPVVVCPRRLSSAPYSDSLEVLGVEMNLASIENYVPQSPLDEDYFVLKQAQEAEARSGSQRSIF